MSLYLGTEKVGITFLSKVTDLIPSGNFASGDAWSDDDGIVTFPELSFTPNMIALWNVQERDLREEAEANGEEWDDSYVQYIYEGTMVFAIYQDDTWISQAMGGQSAEMYISNASHGYPPCVTSNGNIYSYRLARAPEDGQKYGRKAFKYIICG